MLVQAQIIGEGLCAQTDLPESSEDEDATGKSHFVNEDERLAIQKQFDQLPAESMFEIMHIIEQSEHRSASNSDRKYNVMYFSPSTISLIKKAIDRAMRVQNKANLRCMKHTERKNLQLSLQTKLDSITQNLSNKKRKHSHPAFTRRMPQAAHSAYNYSSQQRTAKMPAAEYPYSSSSSAMGHHYY
ncbi:hypothetical protein KR222_010440 [Zaprionus bogoriensis]|nr:hypothetical protein KR222_010440 [Zaprionus bogoriensis]